VNALEHLIITGWIDEGSHVIIDEYRVAMGVFPSVDKPDPALLKIEHHVSFPVVCAYPVIVFCPGSCQYLFSCAPFLPLSQKIPHPSLKKTTKPGTISPAILAAQGGRRTALISGPFPVSSMIKMEKVSV
jgi:hypothetical protein